MRVNILKIELNVKKTNVLDLNSFLGQGESICELEAFLVNTFKDKQSVFFRV